VRLSPTRDADAHEAHCRVVLVRGGATSLCQIARNLAAPCSLSPAGDSSQSSGGSVVIAIESIVTNWSGTPNRGLLTGTAAIWSMTSVPAVIWPNTV
jgi:hypothetical protein